MQCSNCHNAVEGNPPFCPTCGAPLPREVGPDPLIGRVFQDKYKIVKLLGEGGMGAVYVGEQSLGQHTRRVAIKTLHSHLSRDEQVRDRFQREVGTLATLEHPNTVQVFDFGTSPDGILYIVMEFVQGRSIADVLEKEGAFSPDRVEKIIAQICGSLAEAHSKGIIHRDLKPDNIVLTERAGQKDFVKVLDFGIAKRSGEADRNEKKLTQQGMVLGTPPYMSPEQFTGQSLDPRSDEYSLAVMAYEMLTGTLPFDASTAWEWATLHMTAAPKAIEAQPHGAALPESMRSAVMRALAKDPEQRFPTITDFSDRFCGRVSASPEEIAQRQATSNHRSLPPDASPMAPPTNIPQPAALPFAANAQSYVAPPVAMAAAAGGDPLKGKTQMGEPLALPPMDFGTPPPPPMQQGYAPPPPMQQGYAPPPAYPQAGIPQGPSGRASQGGDGGSKKGIILAAAAVVGILSIGLVAWGAGAFHTEPTTIVPPLDLPTAQPTTVVTTAMPTRGYGAAPDVDERVAAHARHAGHTPSPDNKAATTTPPRADHAPAADDPAGPNARADPTADDSSRADAGPDAGPDADPHAGADPAPDRSARPDARADAATGREPRLGRDLRSGARRHQAAEARSPVSSNSSAALGGRRPVATRVISPPN